MRAVKKILREASYSQQYISRNQLDYGGFYYITYTVPEHYGNYYIFVIQPNIKGKTHCLDLSLIDANIFDKFFKMVRMDDEVRVQRMKEAKKGYVKTNIRIGTNFYDHFIKNNKRLMKDLPYKTLEFNKINNVRYIAYDVY